jgi:hypothetical protein
VGVVIQLFEVGGSPLDFCLWGLMKSEVYKEKETQETNWSLTL